MPKSNQRTTVGYIFDIGKVNYAYILSYAKSYWFSKYITSAICGIIMFTHIEWATNSWHIINIKTTSDTIYAIKLNTTIAPII